MRLSEAIRLGSMLKPQSCDIDSRHAGTGSCALQAAMEARNANAGADEWSWAATTEGWEWITDATTCHLCGTKAPHVDDVESLIWHLNDDHKWTREHIAKWVETLEDARSASINGDQHEEPQSVDAVRQTVEQPVVSIRA